MLKSVLLLAYVIMLVASLALWSRTVGSLVARYFLAIGVASAIGIAATLLEMLSDDLGIINSRLLSSSLVSQALLVLAIHVPLLIVALALASVASVYSRHG